MFRTGPVEQADRTNLTAGFSGYFDRTSLASKQRRAGEFQSMVGFSEHPELG
jgi:hypothetical protein